MLKKITCVFFTVIVLTWLTTNAWAQPRKRVILEAFWWEGRAGGGIGPGYRNDNYPLGWFNYLADMAPRLRQIGIDAVWIPPTIKNAVGAACLGPEPPANPVTCTRGLAPVLPTAAFGYAPFDFYDLGDKYQKASLRTKLGTKDEYLRMVAVLHANGIEVIQDVVFNQLTAAGSAAPEDTAPGTPFEKFENFAGGRDDSAHVAANGDKKYKNFRYVSFSTPATNESAANYLARSGRWSRNWQNFHPNPGHPEDGPGSRECDSGEVCGPNFGRDVCYNKSAFGQSSTPGIFNPTEAANYMRSEAARWLLWMKDQTGVDGFRWDAAKHFDAITTSQNTDHGTVAAVLKPFGANSDIVSVAEVVDSAANQDSWTDSANTDAGSDVVGTFDFPLRQKLRDMALTFDTFDMQSIPGAQQRDRSRTVPFINNHDTFRPILDRNGNYGAQGDLSRWDNGNELSGGHLDPREERLSGAYAIAFAVEGSPQVFFEDLFDVGTTGKRFSHQPTSETDLPANDDLVNIIWCHRNLRFKDGAYKVRTAAAESPIWPEWQNPQDLLVIERSQKAIIGVNHNHDTWRAVTIRTDFSTGTKLHDYSGANSGDITVPADQRITIWTPPAKGDGAVKRKGYTIWGPAGLSGSQNTPMSTTQTWEMANDLGDAHPNSLGQGGALAAADRNRHYVGQIQSPAGQAVAIRIVPGYEAKRYQFTVLAVAGNVAFDSGSVSGTRTFNFNGPGSGEQRLRFFLKSACPESGTGGDPNCTVPPSHNPTTMTLSVTYMASAVAATLSNPMGPNVVVNPGIPVRIDSGAQGSDHFFYVEVPPGATTVRFELEPATGASGDADLFVKFGTQATSQSFDRKSQTAGSSTESVTITSPPPGGWYIDVAGASAFSKVNLLVTLTTG